MIKRSLIFLFLFVPTLALAISPIRTVSGKVTKVLDGDTVNLVTYEGETLKIRLYGLDAPEKAQNYGPQASAALARWISGKEVEVEIYDVDRYGRSVGVIKINVNQQMIIDGNAWHYARYDKLNTAAVWQADENMAKAQRLGLWRDPNAINPEIFRRQKAGSR
ncbi:MAG: thermonuclease family protein [Elusimicrobiota bacterium]|jgi:micrococcal nuclease|nr:thermonuclease family protein [Elusimicrobiota bacterium]